MTRIPKPARLFKKKKTQLRNGNSQLCKALLGLRLLYFYKGSTYTSGLSAPMSPFEI